MHTPSQEAEINRFHMKMIRKVAHIPYSFYSRISHAEVRKAFGITPLTAQIWEQRMKWFGHVMRRSAKEPIRWVVDDNGKPREWPAGRLRGQPRLLWSEVAFKEAAALRSTYPTVAEDANLERVDCILEDSAAGRQAWRKVIEARRAYWREIAEA